MPATFLISLVSQYDAFLGNLISKIFLIKPEILNGSDRKLSFSELTQFSSIEDARSHISDKEVESVIRESHAKHFDWLEKTLKIELRKDLPIWPTFIEVTERRNLLSHAGGVVSSQYLNVCRSHGVDIPEDVKIGTKLDVKPEYFRTAYGAVFEVGVKLAQVAWRKLLPAEISDADDELNRICITLIKMNRFKLAKRLLDFACLTLKKHANERSRRIFVINRAQVYKKLGTKEELDNILGAEDWSSCGDDFKICVSVLKNDFQEAEKIMRKIGKGGDIVPFQYAEWPVFREFRKTQEFRKAYQELFGDKFIDPDDEVSTNDQEVPVDHPKVDPEIAQPPGSSRLN